MRLAVTVLAGSFLLLFAASLAEARTMPDWDPAEECKVVTSDDDVAANPLYNACLAKERASYQTLEAKRDGIADAQWRECMAIAEIEKSFTLLLDCLQDSPTGAVTSE